MSILSTARRSRPALLSRALSTKAIPSWATIDPYTMSAATPAIGKNLCGGEWMETKSQHAIVDPLNGEAAALMMREPEQYAARIRESVAKYGQAEPLNAAADDDDDDMDDDDDDDDD